MPPPSLRDCIRLTLLPMYVISNYSKCVNSHITYISTLQDLSSPGHLVFFDDPCVSIRVIKI